MDINDPEQPLLEPAQEPNSDMADAGGTGRDQRSPSPEGSGTPKPWRADLGSLDEDMEKLFEPTEKFSIAKVIGSESDVPTARHKFNENDYQSHRGAESFPHMHHPLKSIHSRSMRRRMSRNSESDVQDARDRSPSVQTTSSYPNFSAVTSRSTSVDNNDSPHSPSLQEVGFYVGDDGGGGKVEADGKTVDANVVEEDEEHVETSPLLSNKTGEQIPIADSTPVVSSSFPRLSPEMSPEAIAAKGRVKFEVGNEEVDEGEETPTAESDKPSEEKHRHRRHKHSRHHHHKHNREEDPAMRQWTGIDFNGSGDIPKRVPTEPDEAILLQQGDLDEMASHRFEDVRGIRRHKIQAKSAVSSFIHVGTKDGNLKQMKTLPLNKKMYDRSPHEVFVELDELFTAEGEMEWKETARWIKYEEDLEEGANRWGKPHVAPLSFHSLLNLRKCLDQGTVLLDLEERDLPGIAYRVVEQMVINDQINSEDKGAVMRALLLRHRHVNEHRQFQFGLRRNFSGYNSLMSLADDKPKPQKSVSFSVPHNDNHATTIDIAVKMAKDKNKTEVDLSRNIVSPIDENVAVRHCSIDMKETDSLHTSNSSQDDLRKQAIDISIMKKIPGGAEATTVLVGGVDFLEQPTIAFVRLAEGTVLPTLLEVPVPVRFMFILLGPTQCDLDYHEIGRSISTLMSNRTFHEAAYKADDSKDLMRAINEFLDDSIVLPPGDWHDKSLLPISEIQKKTEEINMRKRKVNKEKVALLSEDDDRKKPSDDPLQRTKRPFGGLIRDIKRRFPLYWSDITDAFNFQCVSATIFIYFAALSGAISFGGILSNKTHNLIGVSETMVATSICGILFSLLAAQPLMIIGVTGPVLLFDESLFTFCESYGIEFLPMRMWVGIWLTIIATMVVAVEGSFFLRYFTRFIEDILSALISIIYIYESMTKLVQVFQEHPLRKTYCFVEGDPGNFSSTVKNDINATSINSWTTESDRATSTLSAFDRPARSLLAVTTMVMENVSSTEGTYPKDFPLTRTTAYTSVKNQPNTALLTMILMLGTFFIAYFLRQFRNSHYLGRTARRALGDFGVPIAIATMVCLDYFIEDTYTEKLSVPQGLTPSDPSVRGWVINPMGQERRMPVWQIFAAFLPALLFFILLFMEVQICELIMGKKERMLQKGTGFHLDILLMCFLNLVSSTIGGPWMSAAIVRAIAHILSLTVMSRTHAPGDKPHILDVKDQRITNLLVSLLVGFSVLMTNLLRIIPFSVLFGIFIYMGVVSMNGVQFFERLRLFLVPAKHYPQVAYVHKVETWRMHLFTIIQLLCFALLWAIKSSVAAIALPFVLLMMLPLRSQLTLIFTNDELKALDSAETEVKDVTEEPDFYEEAPIPG